MSNYRSDEDPSTESSNFSPCSPLSRYRINLHVSGSHIPNRNPTPWSGHVSGNHTPSTYISASTNATNGPWNPNDDKYCQPPAVPSPSQHSADLRWDTSRRPLDRSRSKQPSDYGSPLLASNVNWNRAEQQAFYTPSAVTKPNHWQGYAETEQPQPLPQVNEQQRRLARTRAIPDTAGQAQAYYAPSPPLVTAAATIRVPEGAVGVVKEVTLEAQSVSTERRVSFTTAIQPPVTTIQATATQKPAFPQQRYTITLDQVKAVKERKSDESNQPEQGGPVSRSDTGDLPLLTGKRRASFRMSLSRAGRKVSHGFLDALRFGTEPPVVYRADKILDEWNTYILQFDEMHTEMEKTFDPFQDQIENAFNVKYQELLGEGKFLINDEEETELPAEVPVELPVQEVQVVPTEDADTWIAYMKAEEAITEARDIYTGSFRRRLAASELVVHPPKPRTYSAGPPPPAPVSQPVEPECAEDGQHSSTPSPVNSPQPAQAEMEVKVGQPKTPSPRAKERQSKSLPNRTGRSTSRHRPTSRRPSAAQPVEEPKSRTPFKARKDSAQTESPTKPAVQRRAQSRDQERYPKVRNLKK